jgi:lambda family phage tail tape measure protein
MMAAATRAATLLIDVVADVAKIRRDFDDASNVVKGFGRQMEVLGNVVKGALAGFSIERVIAFGEAIQANVDAMADLAENLKFSVEDFQALQNSAYLAGQSIESVGGALAKFNVFIGKAAEGGKEQIETLNQLGVKVLDANGRMRDQATILQEIAKAITSIEDPFRRAAAEVAVFGKSGQAISATLEQLKRPITELNRELSAMGLVHSPETIKQLADMADKADIAAKRVEVLFAPFYAMAKSAVLQGIASAFQAIANAINAINVGNLDGIVRALAAMALIPTIIGAPAGIALLNGIKTPLELIDQQITETQTSLDGLRKSLETMRGNPSFTDAQKLAEIEKYNAAVAKLTDLQGQRSGMTGAVVDMRRTGGTGNPAVTGGGGVDKFAEAMRRLNLELEASNKALVEFNKLSTLPSAEAARRAQLDADIAKRQGDMIKGLTDPAQIETVKKLAEQVERAKFAFEETKNTQKKADQINERYGDGVKKLADNLYYLEKAYADNRIGLEEYRQAVEDYEKDAERQRLIHEGLGEGLQQVAAGFQYAALQARESQSSFATGQQLFTGMFQTMSQALSDFVRTGELNFGKLAESFAAMLADMAAKRAASAIFDWLWPTTGGTSPAAAAMPHGATAVNSGGIFANLFGWLGGIFGGGRQHGGPVRVGSSYLVGEHGPERFIPDANGRIGPNGGGGVSVEMGGISITTSGAGGPSAGQAVDFARKMRAAVVDVIHNEQRPGGTLYSRG